MKALTILFLLALTFSSCNIINPDEEPVSFIRIEDFPLVITDEDLEGQPSEKITDVWIEVDGELIGGFEMPVSIPVLREGVVNVVASPGIQKNGISTDRIRYPLYDFHKEDITLVKGQEITIQPEATYIQDLLTFDIEAFEDPGIRLERDVTSDTLIYFEENLDTDDQLRGSHYGAVFVDEERPHFKIKSAMNLDLMFKNIVYIELDYKCDGPFVVGLKRTLPTIEDYSLAGFNPTYDSNGNPTWNKVYIDLEVAIDALGNEEEYEIFLEGTSTSTESQTYLFDNIKIVYPTL